MSILEFEGAQYPVADGETVLACLERNGHVIPNSCRSGVCHSCMVRKTAGDLPAAAQKGVKAAHQAQGYFLACQCIPESDLAVAKADAALERVGATLTNKEMLNHRVLRVVLEPSGPLDYFPGQFLNFVRPGGLVRSFSVASVPALDGNLEFHVALVPDGKMSGWLHGAETGETLDLQGPLGSCFYTPGDPEQPLFLLGTGTGLAPLYGIVRDALHQGHTGPIHLFHGALVFRDLYLADALRALDGAHENFHYHACIRDEAGPEWAALGDVDTVALEKLPDLKGWRVFLCGNPALVRQVQRKCFMAGASMQAIHADAFLPASG